MTIVNLILLLKDKRYMELTISMKREKTILVLIVGLVAFGTVFLLTGAIMTSVYGFFHDHNKDVSKPEFYINPIIQAELDILYEKYPHITQQDIYNVHTSASAVCFTETKKQMDDDPESRDNVFGQAIGMGMCQGFMAGMVENYLDALGVAYYEGESGEPPILIGN